MKPHETARFDFIFELMVGVEVVYKNSLRHVSIPNLRN